MLHYLNVVPYAQRSLEIMGDRLRKWMARSPEDAAKIGERADELRDFANLLEYLEQFRTDIPEMLATDIKNAEARGFSEGYQQGFSEGVKVFYHDDYAEMHRAYMKEQYPNVDLEAEVTDDDNADLYAEFPWLQQMEKTHTEYLNRCAA